jgi:cell division protein FtsL
MARSGLKEAMASGRALGPVGHAVLMAAPVVAAALLYVWTQSTTVTLGYTLSEAAAQQKQLLEINRNLRIEAAALRSSDRLQRDAQAKFGLAPPKTEQVVRIRGQY